MPERTEMGMLRWMMGTKRIEKIRNEEIRAGAGVANISEKISARAGVENISKKIREARLRWLGRVERKTKEGAVRGTPKDRKTETEVQ